MTEQTMDPQRAELYGRLRTARGAAVALQLAEHQSDDRCDLAARLTQAERADGELEFVVAGAVAMILAACDLMAEATAEDPEGVTADEVLVYLTAQVASHIHATTAQLRELGTDTNGDDDHDQPDRT